MPHFSSASLAVLRETVLAWGLKARLKGLIASHGRGIVSRDQLVGLPVKALGFTPGCMQLPHGRNEVDCPCTSTLTSRSKVPQENAGRQYAMDYSIWLEEPDETSN